ncbi:C2H2-type zinc finger protein [Xenorhabdus bovienii]|uniref:C2H2-type zinc finger protein n=1 Tax=Xenorhabdus bovienii TaxID=40576 RepID=UPI0008FFAB60
MEVLIHNCTICPKTFWGSAELERHMLTHTRERPFLCDSCGYRSTQKGNLKRHMLTHTDANPIPCEVENCGRRFRDVATLSKHLSGAHNMNREYKTLILAQNYQPSASGLNTQPPNTFTSSLRQRSASPPNVDNNATFARIRQRRQERDRPQGAPPLIPAVQSGGPVRRLTPSTSQHPTPHQQLATQKSFSTLRSPLENRPSPLDPSGLNVRQRSSPPPPPVYSPVPVNIPRPHAPRPPSSPQTPLSPQRQVSPIRQYTSSEDLDFAVEIMRSHAKTPSPRR